MVNVCVLQTDNRPSLDYLLKTQTVNKMFCEKLGYDYLFLEMNNCNELNIHPATQKIFIVNNFLKNNPNYDVLVFLDSDAWIQEPNSLSIIINDLISKEQKHGCFSRDISVIHHTYINSGAFILKNNNYTREMYNNLEMEVYNNATYHYLWPYDQYYISKYIYENKDFFIIFNVEVMNTPVGSVLRHNWAKDIRMYDDLNKLIEFDENLNPFKNFDIINNLDDTPFPNINNEGYKYFTI